MNRKERRWAASLLMRKKRKLKRKLGRMTKRFEEALRENPDLTPEKFRAMVAWLNASD